MLLEQIVQVFPASALYWLGFFFAPRRFVLLRQKLATPASSQTFTALSKEVDEAVQVFFTNQPALDVNDGGLSMDVANGVLTIRRLCLSKEF